MSAELVKITDPDEIAALPVEQRGQLITAALEESKGWLAVATKGTDPTPIAEFKAWAATVAEMTRQKGLAEEIQFDAQEMVRRAERGIGVAIRNGQGAGHIAGVGDIGGRGEQGIRGAVQGAGRGQHLDRPSKFAERDVLHKTIYPVTDGVTDEQFDEALGQARSEKNLSRANVVRKVQGEANDAMTSAEKLATIAEMAASGHTSKQIGPRIGVSDQRVRDLARKNDIDIPADRVTSRTHGINPERVIREAITSLEGVSLGLSLLEPHHFTQLDRADVKQWADSLSTSLRTLNKFRKDLNDAQG